MKRKSANRKKRTVAVARPHVSETEALMQMARLINDQPDVDRVCQRIVQFVLTLLPVRFSAITLLDPDGGLRLVAQSGDCVVGADWGRVLPPGTG